MPKEIFDVEAFVKLSEHAGVCKVRRSADFVKLKLRTPNRLYTLKVKLAEAEGILKRLKCAIVEV